MKMIVRNFINVLKRFRLASFLNIAGLAIALTAFLILFIQVDHEWNFDKCHPNADRIFRVDMPRTLSGDTYASVLTRGFIDEVLTSSAHIETGTLVNLFMGKIYLTIGEGDDKKGFSENFVTCYPDIVNIFGFNMVEGDTNCLTSPEKILIPESLAQKMFGKESAVGKLIHSEEKIWTKSNVQTFTIGGVYKDFPANTQLDNHIYTAIDNTQKGDWYSQNYIGYVLLNNAEAKEEVEQEVNKLIDFQAYSKPEETRLELIPLTDIYYSEGQLTDFIKAGNKNTTKLLFFIAILVIVVACINFINFSTALAPSRMKSINTHKVLGSSTINLRNMLVTEAVGMSLLACTLAFVIVRLLDQAQFLTFIIADLNLLHHISLCLTVVGLSIILGIISGIYPAYYMTSFPPALVLKGNFALSVSGRRLRTTLIGFQYIVSMGLIICALFIQLQNHFMRSYDLGFNKDQLAMVIVGSKLYNNSKDVYTQKLKEHPGIENVAFSNQAIGRFDSYTAYDMYYKDQRFNTYVIDVSWNFLEVMNIPVISGRDFTISDTRNDSTSYYIYDRKIQEMFNIETGDYLDPSWRGQEVITGFTGDVKFTSLRQGEDYIAFKLDNQQTLPISYIRLKAGSNTQEVVQHIRHTLNEIDPSYPFTIDFYDNFFDFLYQKEESLNKMITTFSLLAIILSIVGVFGLVMFETQYRRKEIGVRKVFGATVAEILKMFNYIYLRIICICFIITVPIAYILAKRWLEGFHYRTPIHWWVFAVAFLIITAITLFTVSYQNWRAANENPVNSIKTE